MMSRVPYARTLRVLPFLAALALSGTAAPGWAQPADALTEKVAAAQALFDQALTAMAERDFGAACPKLEEVTRLLPNGIGGQLNLALCYEGAGRLASAWTTFVIAEALAVQAHRSEEEAEARKHVEALKPKLARITVDVGDAVRPLPGLSVERDGIPVGAAQWSTPVPVDKGRHVVMATATGKTRWEKAVEVPADGADVSVRVDSLIDVKVEAPATPPVVEAPPRVAPPAVQQAASPGPLIVGGIGVAGLIVGAVTGAVVVVQKGVANAHCAAGPPPKCADQTGLDAASAVRTLGPMTTVALTAGAAGVAAGAIWLGVRRSKSSSVRIGAAPAYAGALGRIEGSW